MVMAIVLTLGFSAGGAWVGSRAVTAIVGSTSGQWTSVFTMLLTAAVWVLAVLIALLLAMTFAQPLSGFALDRIVREQERALPHPKAWPEQPLLAQVGASLVVTLTGLLFAALVIGPLFAIEMVFPPSAVVIVPLKFVAGGLLLVWDFADYPLSLRNKSVRARLVWMRDNFRFVLGFGLAAGTLLMIPCLGLLVLPMGVAGAARLVVRSNV